MAVFPLGLALIDAALRQAGHESLLLDLNSSPVSITQAITSFRPNIVGISLRNIDDVMIGKREVFFSPLAGLCREVRETCDAAIVLGGSGFSIFPERLLALSGADYGIQGEGEASFLRLLDALENRANPLNIPGLIFRRNRKSYPIRKFVGRWTAIRMPPARPNSRATIWTVARCSTFRPSAVARSPVVIALTRSSRAPASVAVTRMTLPMNSPTWNAAAAKCLRG